MSGIGRLIEADEALLGKKPTYGHSNVNKVFKIWILGICLRSTSK